MTSKLVVLVGVLAGGALAAQGPQTVKAVQTAMDAELARSLQGLALPGLEKPFFLGYVLRDLEYTCVRASLGGLVSSATWRYRDHQVELLVGDAFRNNAHFVSPPGSASTGMPGQVPLEDDVHGLRTAYWLTTDGQYKAAAEAYERKMAALAQQQLPEAWRKVPDLDQAPTCVLAEPMVRSAVDLPGWERKVRDLSAVLLNHPGIHASEVSFHLLQGDRYLATSQKAQVVQPMALAALHVSLRTQAEDGLPLADSVVYYGRTAQDLPEPAVMAKDVGAAAAYLQALRSAPAFDDTYDGPVLFEGQAVAELVARRFFSPDAAGLVAVRRPLYADTRTEAMSPKAPESMEDKLGARILPRLLTLKATPRRTAFEATPLIGAFAVDAQGVAPQEVTLVEQGMLRDLLRGRAPTVRCPVSNGHQRVALNPWLGEDAAGPGVIDLEAQEPSTPEALRQELLRRAKDAGLTHAYVVRKLVAPTAELPKNEDGYLQAAAQGEAAGFATPAQVLRVEVATGTEEPVRNVVLGKVSLMALRHVAGASNRRFAHNTLLVPISANPQRTLPVPGRYGWTPSGVPASFIVPHGLLFEELNLKKEPIDIAPKPPVAPSPLVKCRK